MNIVNLILDNPVYTLLFGSGGMLIVILTVIGIRRKRTDRGGDINKRRAIKVTIEEETSKKEIEEEKPLKLNRSESLDSPKPFVLEFEPQAFRDSDEAYISQNFKKEEFYLQFLKTVEEKKKRKDEIKYE